MKAWIYYRRLAVIERAVLIIISCLVFAAGLNAEPMPNSAPHTLSQILSAPEFQPRQIPKGYFTELREQILKYVLDRIHDIGTWIHNKAQHAELNPAFINAIRWFFDTLESILYGIKDIFDKFGWLLLAAAVIAAAIFAYLRYRNPLRISLGRTLAGPRAQDEALDADSLAKLGDWTKLLVVLRKQLRKLASTKYALASSATDRELSKIIPVSDGDKPVYDEVIGLFEELAFARSEVLAQRIQDAYTRCRSIAR